MSDNTYPDDEVVNNIVDMVNTQIDEVTKSIGVPSLSESDPEYAAFKTEMRQGVAEENMTRIIQATQKAAKQKAARLEEEKLTKEREAKLPARAFLERAHNPAHGSNTAKPTAQPTPPTTGRAYLERAHSNKGR